MALDAPAPGRRRSLPLCLAALLLLVPAVLIVLSARTTHMAVDEHQYFSAGRVIVHHGFVHEITRSQGPLALYANQLFVTDFPSGGIDPAQPQPELVFRGRLGTLPFALLSAALVFAWARRLYGDAGGLLALLVHALDPLLLGYGSLMLVDAQHAAMVLLALFVLWRYLETRSSRVLPWVGVTVGLAMATKYLAVFLAVPAGLTVAAAAASAPGHGRRPRLAAGAGALALFAATALFTLHAAYLFREGLATARPEGFDSGLLKGAASAPVLGQIMALLPPPFLRGVDFQLTQSQRDWQPFLNGVFQHGHADYYVWTILCKTPEVVLACALLALGLHGRRLFRADAPAGWRTTAVATLPYAALLFVYMSFSPMQLGVRYVLPLYPLLSLLVGALAWRLSWPRTLALGALLAGLLGWDLACNWPYWNSYYNRASGGQALAFRRFRDSTGDFLFDELSDLRALRERLGGFQVLDGYSGPRFGRLAVDVQALNKGCDWLTWLDPIAHQGAAWWIFELTPEAFEARVAESGDATLRRDLAIAYLADGRRADAERHLARLEHALAAPLRDLIAAEDAARARPERRELEALLKAWGALRRPDRAEAIALEHPDALGGSPVAVRVRAQALEERRDFAGAAELIERSHLDVDNPLQIELLRHLRRMGAWSRATEVFEALARAREGRPATPIYQELASDFERYSRLEKLLR